VYYAFDVLQLDGRNLTAQPLDERRQRLAAVVHDSGVLLSQPLSGDVDDIIEAARRLKLEGLVAKRRDSRYEPRVRSTAWQKLRLNRSQEFVVGGYSPGSPFDALLVGYYQDDVLLFAARVRAGFAPASRREVFRRLGPALANCAFANLPMGRSGGWNEGVSVEDMKMMTWVEPPRLVVQVAFVEWTDYGLLRHAG
jgi:bifunctional non-homologous end joining protein LigD